MKGNQTKWKHKRIASAIVVFSVIGLWLFLAGKTFFELEDEERLKKEIHQCQDLLYNANSRKKMGSFKFESKTPKVSFIVNMESGSSFTSEFFLINSTAFNYIEESIEIVVVSKGSKTKRNLLEISPHISVHFISFLPSQNNPQSPLNIGALHARGSLLMFIPTTALISLMTQGLKDDDHNIHFPSGIGPLSTPTPHLVSVTSPFSCLRDVFELTDKILNDEETGIAFGSVLVLDSPSHSSRSSKLNTIISGIGCAQAPLRDHLNNEKNPPIFYRLDAGYHPNSDIIKRSHSRHAFNPFDTKKAEGNDMLAVHKHGLLIKRDHFLKASGFDASLEATEFLQDVDFSIRLMKLFVGGKLKMSNLILRSEETESVQLYSSIIKEESQLLHGREEPNDQQYIHDLKDVHKEVSKAFYQRWAPSLKEFLKFKRKIDSSLIWDNYCGCTGLNIETIGFLSPLEKIMNVATVSGPSCFCPGFPTAVSQSVDRAASNLIQSPTFFVSHKPATSYPKWPYKGNVEINHRPKFVIGRSMTESEPLPDEWVEKCNTMVDQVWVPSDWHAKIFEKSGVDKNRLRVVPEAIDVSLWDPKITVPLDLDGFDKSEFNFFSVFKWEERKGWDILLAAFFEEFKEDEEVNLYLQTYLYGASEYEARDPDAIIKVIRDWMEEKGYERRNLRVYPITQERKETEMPSLYKNFDAFVLPTRGEGWGLPIMEAMAMELPTIATAWSGQTQFMNSKNSYQIRIEGTEPTTDNENLNWAKPSLSHLKSLMRKVTLDKDEAKSIGKQARRDIVENFSYEKVSQILVQRIEELEDK